MNLLDIRFGVTGRVRTELRRGPARMTGVRLVVRLKPLDHRVTTTRRRIGGQAMHATSSGQALDGQGQRRQPDQEKSPEGTHGRQCIGFRIPPSRAGL